MRLYSIIGWDHRWPGPHHTSGMARTDPLHGFDAAHVIWSFFEHYRRRLGGSTGAGRT